MKVLKLNTPFELSAVVRTAPDYGDVLVFKAINEFSQVEIVQTLVWTKRNDRLSFILASNIDFVAGNKYEISISNNSKVIYLGKMIVVKEITDIQNYSQSKQTTPRFI
jgi:hypothetical protein